MTVPQQKWIAGWPVASWIGFVGALAATSVALWLYYSAGRVDGAAIAAAFICVSGALAARRAADR